MKYDKLNLPPRPVQVELREGKPYILDELRRKWVRLTPEEWVRQHFVYYLTEHLGYPPTLLMNEVGIRVEKRHKRCDTLLYDRRLSPQMIVEYKAPNIPLSQNTIEQILCYNMALHVPYLVISNGLEHLAYKIHYEDSSYTTLSQIPHYTEL